MQMKPRIFYTIQSFCLLLLLACSKKEQTLITDPKGSLLDELPASEYVLENPGEENPLLFTVSWSATLFQMGDGTTVPAAPVTYTLQIDNAGNEFAAAKILTVTSTLEAKIYTKDLNAFMTDSLGAGPGEKREVELRLLINYGQNTAGMLYSANLLRLAITPFSYSDPLQQVYIIGDMNGWNNLNTTGMFPMFKDNSSNSNYTYTYVGYLPAGCFYKFLPTESLGSYKAYCRKEDGVLEYVDTDGGALYNETAGYKSITINLKDLTYSVADYDASGATDWTMLGFIGEFCGWDNEPLMTRFSATNRHIWTLNLTLPPLSGGNTHPVKFRAERSWGSRWAAADPEASPYGKTIFLTGSEYDPNIVIRQGGDYRIFFNDLTGQYIFALQ